MTERPRDEGIIKRTSEYAHEAAIRVGMIYDISGEAIVVARDRQTGLITQTTIKSSYVNEEI